MSCLKALFFQFCPFVSVIQLNATEPVDAQDLNVLQNDLEHMLVTVAQRMRELTHEIDAFTVTDTRSPAPKSEGRGKDSRSRVRETFPS